MRSMGFIIPILAISVFSVGCASVCNKKTKMIRVLKSQSKVIAGLEQSRNQQKIKKALDKEPILSNAELNLRLSLKRLRGSNQAILKALGAKKVKGDK